MLVISRDEGQAFYIGDIKVVLIEVRGKRARFGIDAPKEVIILREELRERFKPKEKSNDLSAQHSTNPEGTSRSEGETPST